MPKKFAFLAALMLMLTGCSGSADSASAEVANDTAQCVHEKDASACESYVVGGTSAYSTQETGEATQSPMEGEPLSDVQYFVFNRQGTEVTDENGVTLLYEQYCDADFSASDETLDQWVNSLLDGIREDFVSNSTNLVEYAREFVDMNGTELFYSHSNYQDLGIARHDERIVSLISLSSLYSGGAHPNSVQTTYNLDMEHQQLLKLEDVIYEDSAALLEQMVTDSIGEKFESLGEGALFDQYQETIKSTMTYGNMTAYWYLNDQGLVIFYNQYELGPYAAGIIKVTLDYAELDGILREEYFPGSTESAYGELVLKSDWSSGQKISVTIEEDGGTILIGVLGQIYQVQLSEVYWLEDMPIMQEMLFSACEMDENDVLEIKGGFDDASRSFVIEFVDGNGAQKTYYIHDIGLTDQP